ncbi:MAG: hypothetical protein ACOYKE_12390, partial [Ferruginibacter sp.]
PESRRYNTFLIDIGSGNTKGGYFPNGNTQELKLFQLNWGTKSVFNTVDKRCEDDKSLSNFNKQLYRVISGTAAPEIEYAVNESGAYNMNDHIAFSGGIAWSVATLISPELIANPVVPVTFQELQKFNDQLFTSFNKMTPAQMLAKAEMGADEKLLAEKEINRVLKVFDQKSLMAGTALLLKIMRQFEGIYDKKQFYLVKNGQVGWISAYVNQQVK